VAAGVQVNRQELIQRILEQLKIAAYGQPPTAPEQEIVDRNLDGWLDELAAREIYAVTIPDPTSPSVPREAVHALAQALGRMAANDFSLTPAEVNQMFPGEGDPYSPENRLRAINRSHPHYAPANPDYFAIVPFLLTTFWMLGC